MEILETVSEISIYISGFKSVSYYYFKKLLKDYDNLYKNCSSSYKQLPPGNLEHSSTYLTTYSIFLFIFSSESSLFKTISIASMKSFE